VSTDIDLARLLQDRLFRFFDLAGEAIILLNDQRRLVYANRPAGLLLELDPGEYLGARCREATRGIDCSASCPLSFSLKTGGDVVTDFPTVYHKKDGNPLELSVTIFPLKDASGRFAGAVEILRPRKIDLGFFLSGNSRVTMDTRKQILEMDPDQDLLLVGPEAACRNLALALHRISGKSEENFFALPVSSGETWPPRTIYGENTDFLESLGTPHPASIRKIGGMRQDATPICPGGVGKIVLPSLAELRSDLPTIITSRAREIAPSTHLSSGAVEELIRVGEMDGFEALDEALKTGLKKADGELLAEHLGLKTSRDPCLLEFLEAEDPLRALEERLLLEVLEVSEWKIQAAADRLGVSRVTLWRRMKEFGIEKSRASYR